MGTRTVGDVYILNSAGNAANVLISNAPPTMVAADSTTSGGVAFISVNTTGAQQFTITNSGSINIFIQGSFNGVFFQPSVGVIRRAQAGGAAAATSVVECISASTIATFDGPFVAIQVVANSGSGVYRAALTYR